MECLFGCSRNNSKNKNKNKNNMERSSYNPNTNNTKNISKISTSNKPKSSNNDNKNVNVNVKIKPKPSDHVKPSKPPQSQSQSPQSQSPSPSPSHDPTRAPCPDASQPADIDKDDQRPIPVDHGHGSSKARTFTYQELVDATDNFRGDSLLGEGGFGKVFKGHLPHTNPNQPLPVAIKQLDRNGLQGIREFVVEVLTLSLADHPNLVNLIGYCAEGSQRLLVYEYMPLASLETHLHDLRPNQRPLDWDTRMKIAAGAAMGLEYLHDQMKPPIIYRDLKCSNILLGPDYHPKLSDFGLAKVGPVGDKTHVSTRIMGTYGYCAPDYAMTGQLTFKSDIYSFGVVLLEIITGRKAIDNTKDSREQNLVAWAKPLFKDRKKFSQMADPALGGQYPRRGLYQALAIAAMCVQEQPSMRPLIADIVTALKYLASHKYDPQMHSSSTHRRRNPSPLRSTKDYSNKPESADSNSEDEAD